MASRLNQFIQFLIKFRNKILIYAGFVLALGSLLIWLKWITPDEKGPCSAGQFPGQCYRINEDICTTAWTSFDSKCASEIKKLESSLRPGQLTGPLFRSCKIRNFDKVFRFMRKTDEPDCQSEFQNIDSSTPPM